MGLPTHTKCCGCCCSLNAGVIVGCSLFTLLYLIGIIAGSMSGAPDHKLAELFCTDLSAEYRSTYNDCWGSDICDCGGDKCDFEALLNDATTGTFMGFAFSLIAVISFVTTIVGAALRMEPLIKHIWKLLAVLPLFFFLSTCVNAAFASAGVHAITANIFYEAAASEKLCVDGTGADALTTDDWGGRFDVNCRDSDAIGAPSSDSESGRSGPLGGNICDKDSLIHVSTTFSFIFTLIFNVGLLGYLAFNVYSFHQEMLNGGPNHSGSSTGTQMQQPPEHLPAVGVAVAVAVATPAVAVATPAMEVAMPTDAVATPAIAVAFAVPA